MKLGFVGLGKMGKNMVYHLLEQGVEVVAWNRSEDDLLEVKEKGAQTAKNLEELVKALPAPRVVWIMVPQGPPVDEMIAKVLPYLNPGDLVVDGGNSFYKESLRRNKELTEKKIHFMDVGVSGGPGGARKGACLMIGGTKEDYKLMEPVFKLMAAPGAYLHMGRTGAGHFAKMVHNGIEYGMMQAIAEGAAVLKKSEFDYDLAKIFDLYNKRSVIESRLVEWTKNALEEDPELTETTSKITALGEGEWTVNTAKELGVEVPVIEKSFQIRTESRETSENFRDKVVSAMRGQFGGHPVLKQKASC